VVNAALGEPPLLLSSSVYCVTQVAIKEARKQLRFWKRNVAFESGGMESQFYYCPGIFTSSRGTDLDHGLLAVGYGLTGEKMIGDKWVSLWRLLTHQDGSYLRIHQLKLSADGFRYLEKADMSSMEIVEELCREPEKDFYKEPTDCRLRFLDWKKMLYSELDMHWKLYCDSRVTNICVNSLKARIFKGYKIDPSTTLSHLFYADDAVFIGEWSHSNLKGIMNILRCFSLLSGMSINIQKSHLLGVGIPDNCVAEAAKSIGCLIMKAPFKYLGILVGDNMSSKKAWDETINKMKKRLSRWKLNTLSVGGRLTLLKSVLGSTPIYNMSIFKVPKSVLNYMESLRRNFFNGFQEGDRKIAWVKWSKVLASKKFGGLGVSSFFALNRALLFKWVWRYLSHDNSLWSRIISALHGLNGHVLSAAFNSTWSSIITEVNSLKVKGVDLISHCKIRVGKGTGTSFWKDLWIGDNLLKLSFPRLFALEENKDISVADKMNTSISSSFRRHVRGGVESQQLDQLSLLLDTVILSNMDDRWFWDLNGDGVFQVKDVRSMLDEAFLPKMEVPTRWIKSIPIKVNVFAWKLYLDRLPTRSNLSRRNVSLPSLACPLCDHVLEDSSHLFFGCSVAKDIQKLICRWWNLDVHPYESYEDWLSWFKSIRLGSKTKEVLEGVFYVSWWSLWNFRNQFLFASPIPRKDAIFDNIVLRSFYWCVARCNRTLNWVSWLQHPFLIPL
ncbi:RNA-directed DNA polymerase, eukaryota, partial [Tanacetum coccineum]